MEWYEILGIVLGSLAAVMASAVVFIKSLKWKAIINYIRELAMVVRDAIADGMIDKTEIKHFLNTAIDKWPF